MKEWPPYFDNDLTPVIGDDPHGEPRSFPDPVTDVVCGWCGRPVDLFDPFPKGWTPGRFPQDESHSLLPVLYRCSRCARPHLAVWVVRPDDERLATITEKPTRLYPTGAAERFTVDLYRGTVIEECRNEAWADFHAGRHRSAAVMARAALQTLARRYLSMRSNFQREVDELAKIAGAGWAAVGLPVKTFANQWAHPDPLHPAPPSREEALRMLELMDQVIAFTAAMETVGHLAPVEPDQATGPGQLPTELPPQRDAGEAAEADDRPQMT